MPDSKSSAGGPPPMHVERISVRNRFSHRPWTCPASEASYLLLLRLPRTEGDIDYYAAVPSNFNQLKSPEKGSALAKKYKFVCIVSQL